MSSTPAPRPGTRGGSGGPPTSRGPRSEELARREEGVPLLAPRYSLLATPSLGEETEEPPEDVDPLPDLLDAHFLIRCVEAVVREPAPGGHPRRAAPLQLRRHRNRPARPHRNRPPAHHRLEGLVQDPERRMGDVAAHRSEEHT